MDCAPKQSSPFPFQNRCPRGLVATARGIDRFETDSLHHRHRLSDYGLTFADLEMDRAALSEVLETVRQ